METAETSITATAGEPTGDELPVAALASVLTFAAAGALLGYSLLARKRRVPVPVQLLLGLLAGTAAIVAWQRRQEELKAARFLMELLHDVRDRRWLKRHPIAYR